VCGGVCVGGGGRAFYYTYTKNPRKKAICFLCVCVFLLQDLLQSCSRGGGRRVEDMCYERRRAEACVDESAHHALYWSLRPSKPSNLLSKYTSNCSGERDAGGWLQSCINRATPGLQGGGRSGWTVQASAVGGSCRDSWRSLLCSLAEVRCSTDP